MTINQQIYDQCDTDNLIPSRDPGPIKIGPDCYLVYATELNNHCKTSGRCRVERFYALTGGESIRIIK
jgi:hypothetical protein